MIQEIAAACSGILCLCLAYYWSNSRTMDINKKLHRVKMLQERNSQVAAFRSRMLIIFGTEVVDHMPDYETMLSETKELTAANYIDIKFLTTKN